MLFDVDQFKRINDVHGHLCGDEVLAAIGHRLRQVLRRSDFRCRFGGDEFLIVLPETPAAGAARVAEWVRGEIEQIVVAGRDATDHADDQRRRRDGDGRRERPTRCWSAPTARSTRRRRPAATASAAAALRPAPRLSAVARPRRSR